MFDKDSLGQRKGRYCSTVHHGNFFTETFINVRNLGEEDLSTKFQYERIC